MPDPKLKIMAADINGIDGEAVRQVERTALLPGMRLAVGLPDLHPGQGYPVGAVFFSQGLFYPHLVGNDVGCGIGLWQTGLKRNKLKVERWIKKLDGLETPWDGDAGSWLANEGIEPAGFEGVLGTIGGGNHFAELQMVERVEDEALFSESGLDKNRLLVLIHSGSRGLGESLLRSHLETYGAGGLKEETPEAGKYLTQHDHAIRWAKVNRALIAHRFTSALGTENTFVLDICHNSVTRQKLGDTTGWLHRKGAAASDQGLVVIAGSRGALSYLVKPVGPLEEHGFSIAHGAGRKWSRSDSLARLKARYKPEALMKTDIGSRVICENRHLLYEEAPQAYKNIGQVIDALLSAGLIKPVAALKPLVTYKVRRAQP